ncbi:MAG: DUF1648 domain-containing protein [Burkholderiales bacterium]|nr:DUF1648 domain-containing protein [Burkholderiales bacterium]
MLFLVVSPIVVYVTALPLPARVATHFGRGGVANGWMGHDTYLAFMLLMVTAVPLAVAAGVGLLPAAARSLLRKRAALPAPAHQEEALRWLGGHASLFGCLMCLFLVAIHLLVAQANAHTPPRLDEGTFFLVAGAFVALLAVWVLALGRRLRHR